MTIAEPHRVQLRSLLSHITAWDDVERSHLADAAAWITSDAPLHRTEKPDVPPMHLVSYFVGVDFLRRELLLVDHRKAGLWLPTGGHVEPGESPWETVERECREELHATAVPSALSGRRPFFITITATKGQGGHTDVSLWYVLQAHAAGITSFDETEFSGIAWLTFTDVLQRAADTLDPHMHRFTRKLTHALDGAIPGGNRAPAAERRMERSQ